MTDLQTAVLNSLAAGVGYSAEYLAEYPEVRPIIQELLRNGSVVLDRGHYVQRPRTTLRTGKTPVRAGAAIRGTGKTGGSRFPSKLTSRSAPAGAVPPEVMPLDIRDVPDILTGRRPRTASGVARILNEYAQSAGYALAPYFSLAELVEAGVLTRAQATASRARRAKHLRRHFGTTG